MITFVSHTNSPGGGELALRRYLEVTKLPARLVTMEVGGVWEGLRCEVQHTPSLIQLRRALQGSRLVVANSMRAAALVAVVIPSRARLAYWVRDGLIDSAMTPLALTLTKQITARRTNHYLANSEWTARTIHHALRVEPDRIAVIHSMCGVSETDLERRPRRAPARDAPLRLLFLGRISPWKAPHVAVRALAILRDLGINARLTIAGGALFGEREYAEKLAVLVAAEPEATLVGHVQDVKSLLESHDVLLHCSTKPEPFGQVIVQGLAAGLPVLATATGGPAEILAGAPVEVTYRPGDSSDLVRAIQQAMENYAEQSLWSLQRAKCYTDESAVRKLDEVLTVLRT